MKIYIKHKIAPSEILLQTPPGVTSPDLRFSFDDLIVTGDDRLLKSLKLELEDSSGHYGHLINLEALTTLDLDQGCRDLPSFDLVKVEDALQPNQLPENTVS